MAIAPLVEPAEQLTQAEIHRYSRHLLIPEVGVDGQRRLKGARVLCVGAGGLGSPVLMYLAAAGVGTIGIVDFDVVDTSNLQRQVIHGEANVGAPKAWSAASRIAQINPFVTVRVHQQALARDNALGLFADYDLIVDGTDNFATRYLINDACGLLAKPYVWGSIFRFDGQASLFWRGHGPCYRCLFPQPPPPGEVPSCAEGGVLGVLCASIGAIQATEAIKLITGIGEPLLGELMIYDALAMSYTKIRIRQNPECPLCGLEPAITELIDYDEFCGVRAQSAQTADATISAQTLARWLASSEKIELIDVREPAEHAIVRIPGSTLIPRADLASAVANLPTDRRIVLYCKSGVRSAQALTALQQAGLPDAVHLRGGVLAWIAEIDPTLPTY